jgi:ppGpp synthetase/RelA/SpoT-type nucleotidyltranferase
MVWATPQSSRKRVDEAGDVLAAEESSLDQIFVDDRWDQALAVINNWRSSHSYPLQALKMTLLGRAKRVDDKVVVAQRLKRLTSIRAKLRRFEEMKLSRMHDIGGCRAVVRNVRCVAQLVGLYEASTAKNPSDRAEFIRKYDYIEEPKADGYRCVHLVYKYRSQAPHKMMYNGLRIEIQLRSKLQHAWATAVETVDTFTGQALKSNIGDASWKRFFALMGSAVANREKRARVPGTPALRAELIEELREVTRQLKADTVLEGLMAGTELVRTGRQDAQAFLLELDPTNRRVRATGYGQEELPKASDDYLAVEKRIAGSPEGIQAVLVSVDSIAALRKAFPNYYLDARAFVEAVRQAISA